MSRRNRSRGNCLVVFGLLALFLLVAGLMTFWYIPSAVRETLGPPARSLSSSQRLIKSLQLFPHIRDLSQATNTAQVEEQFLIEAGDTVYDISQRLEERGWIHDASVFRQYLVYAGLDTSIQTGRYLLRGGQSALEIAQILQDATPGEIRFVILPGWRMEEIAAALPTSGLEIDGEELLQVVETGGRLELSQSLPPGSLEGFLLPDQYVLERQASADDIVETFLSNFSIKVNDEIRARFAAQGLDLRQAVTLASIVQREAMIEEEQPFIASVFINRLNQGMKLESDPTVQYAIGYEPGTNTWWKNPLTLADLRLDSVYNTYVYAGIPPGPICNPSLSALRAVAYPAETPYYFFRAACDQSGKHVFSVTFDEHLQKGCP